MPADTSSAQRTPLLLDLAAPLGAGRFDLARVAERMMFDPEDDERRDVSGLWVWGSTQFVASLAPGGDASQGVVVVSADARIAAARFDPADPSVISATTASGPGSWPTICAAMTVLLGLAGGLDEFPGAQAQLREAVLAGMVNRDHSRELDFDDVYPISLAMGHYTAADERRSTLALHEPALVEELREKIDREQLRYVDDLTPLGQQAPIRRPMLTDLAAVNAAAMQAGTTPAALALDTLQRQVG